MRILFASGKGGAGKTTVTASLAKVWPREAIVVDADVEAPNVALFTDTTIESKTPVAMRVPEKITDRCDFCGECIAICQFKAVVKLGDRIVAFPDMCHGCGGCFAVCHTGAITEDRRELGRLESGTVLDGSVRFLMGRTRIGESMTPPLLRQEHARLNEMLTEMMKEDNILEEPDALLDSPPGVSCPAVTVTREADAILLVVDPTPFGFHDFKLAHQAFKPLGKPICAAINRAGAEGNEAGDEAVRAYCRAHALPLLAELPFERAAAEQYAAGLLLADLSPAWHERFVQLVHQIELTGKVHHRTRFATLVYHEQRWNASSASHESIVGTKRRSNVYNTSTIFCGNVVASDYSKCTFFLWSEERKKWFIFKTYKFAAFKCFSWAFSIFKVCFE